MPRNISAAITTEQVLDRTKDVTRRRGWRFLKVGDLLNVVDKIRVANPTKLALVRVVSLRRERLHEITQEDVDREGFPHMAPIQFIAMFCSQMGGDSSQTVTRIEWEYVQYCLDCGRVVLEKDAEWQPQPKESEISEPLFCCHGCLAKTTSRQDGGTSGVERDK